MRYVDEFRDPELITRASEEIRRLADPENRRSRRPPRAPVCMSRCNRPEQSARNGAPADVAGWNEHCEDLRAIRNPKLLPMLLTCQPHWYVD